MKHAGQNIMEDTRIERVEEPAVITADLCPAHQRDIWDATLDAT